MSAIMIPKSESCGSDGGAEGALKATRRTPKKDKRTGHMRDRLRDSLRIHLERIRVKSVLVLLMTLVLVTLKCSREKLKEI